MRLFRDNRNINGGSPNATENYEIPVVSANDFARQSTDLIPAEVRMISGCHSEQTSADMSNVGSVAQLPNPAGRSGGACTSALLEILYRHHSQRQQLGDKKPISFQQVLLELRDSLAQRGLDQIPQLTSSRPLELEDTPFSLSSSSSSSSSSRNTNEQDGTSRALLVGINYIGQNGQLGGCHNDVWNIRKYLVEVQGFQEQNILVLVDDGRNRHFPTRKNIIAALRQLVAQSIAGDSVYFHYSGHGGLLNPEDWNIFKSKNKEYDETVFPVDHARSGQIRDFSLFNNFVKPMPAGVTVTCVMDCCHSGAVLELPYNFQPTSAGTIQMQRNFSNLSNLAFLYLLAGGGLPMGFGNVQEHIQQVTGGPIENYLGAGMEDLAMDDTDFGEYDVADSGAHADAAAADVGDFDDAGVGGPLGMGGLVPAVDVSPDDADGGWDGGYGGFADGGNGMDGDDLWDGGAVDRGANMFGDAGVDGGDVDCSCLGDILGGLMENLDDS